MDFSKELQELATNINNLTRSAAAQLNITFSQAQFLLNVPSEGASMTELASTLGIDISTMSRNVTKLEILNYIQRKKNSDDSRALNLLLTPKGEEVVDLLFAKIDNYTTNILNKIPLDNRAGTATLLETINQTFYMSNEN